jgi:glutamate N-acetyltransferase/amino-acid N-acetyltransferase
LRETADATFNRVSVDGDTSTNDSLFLLDNGAVRRSPAPAELVESFAKALLAVGTSLAEQMAADGEGATRVARLVVKGAPTPSAARKLADTVATSPLFKTALHGADPNWGRVLAALGRAGVAFNPDRVSVKFGKVTVCRNGAAARYGEKAAHRELRKNKVLITVDLHQGAAQTHRLTCDFSKEYVTVNADYTT